MGCIASRLKQKWSVGDDQYSIICCHSKFYTIIVRLHQAATNTDIHTHTIPLTTFRNSDKNWQKWSDSRRTLVEFWCRIKSFLTRTKKPPFLFSVSIIYYSGRLLLLRNHSTFCVSARKLPTSQPTPVRSTYMQHAQCKLLMIKRGKSTYFIMCTRQGKKMREKKYDNTHT